MIDLKNPSKSCQPWADLPTGTYWGAGAVVDSQVIYCNGRTNDVGTSSDCYRITPLSTEALTVSLNKASRGSSAIESQGKMLLTGGFSSTLGRTKRVEGSHSLTKPSCVKSRYHPIFFSFFVVLAKYFKRSELVSLNQVSPGPELPLSLGTPCLIKIGSGDFLLTGGYR